MNGMNYNKSDNDMYNEELKGGQGSGRKPTGNSNKDSLYKEHIKQWQKKVQLMKEKQKEREQSSMEAWRKKKELDSKKKQ